MNIPKKEYSDINYDIYGITYEVVPTDLEFYCEPTNREKSKAAKKTKFWCEVCDAYLVGQYEKCPRCGAKQNTNKIKMKLY